MVSFPIGTKFEIEYYESDFITVGIHALALVTIAMNYYCYYNITQHNKPFSNFLSWLMCVILLICLIF